MQFVIVVDGKVVGQIHWDGNAQIQLPDGAFLLTIGQAIELGIE